MPYFVSNGLFIDFSRLTPPSVIETIQYEKLLQLYKDRVVAKDSKLLKATSLEQSPISIILETEAYGEMMVRARVNAAARAVMLPFAVGSDLDVLGSLYNVERATIPADTVQGTPATPESDQRYRLRIQLAPEAFSTAGTEGSYIFHALDADPTIRDVSVTRLNDRGGVQICVMNTGSNPIATKSQLDLVSAKLFQKNIRPLTDVISIISVNVVYVDLVATVALYPGPDTTLVFSDIYKNLDSLRSRINLIGRDLNRSAIFAALNAEGVQDVNLVTPSEDIIADSKTCVFIKSATITPENSRRE